MATHQQHPPLLPGLAQGSYFYRSSPFPSPPEQSTSNTHGPSPAFEQYRSATSSPWDSPMPTRIHTPNMPHPNQHLAYPSCNLTTHNYPHSQGENLPAMNSVDEQYLPRFIQNRMPYSHDKAYGQNHFPLNLPQLATPLPSPNYSDMSAGGSAPIGLSNHEIEFPEYYRGNEYLHPVVYEVHGGEYPERGPGNASVPVWAGSEWRSPREFDALPAPEAAADSAENYGNEDGSEDGGEDDGDFAPPVAKLSDHNPEKSDGPCKPFISKLAYLLRNPDLYNDCIRWDDSGTTFIIAPSKKFTGSVLPDIFSHSSHAAFTRQLNTYGFRHLSAHQLSVQFAFSPDSTTPIKDLSAWQHIHFSRDRPGALHCLVPRPSKARAAQQKLKLDSIGHKKAEKLAKAKLPKTKKAILK